MNNKQRSKRNKEKTDKTEDVLIYILMEGKEMNMLCSG